MNSIEINENNWASRQLPDSWADRIDFRKLADWSRIIRKALLRRLDRVRLPDNLPLDVPIPKYALQEFHNLPNGNYSKRFTHGYSRGFDVTMLGLLHRHRREMALALHGCSTVLDIGCGAGPSTAALGSSGAGEVWGLDPSPYLLQHAARRYPMFRFVQGQAEDTRLRAQQFDGVSACFVFHEIPPRPADAALLELHRILKPDGRLSIVEPAVEQFFGGPWALFRAHGWKGPYFRCLARLVHEPYARAWHNRDVARWLERHGFCVVSDRTLFPSRFIVARRA